MPIKLPMAKLSNWQQTVFACALLERMLPNYQMFAQAADFGNPKVLRSQLDTLWQRLDKSQKVKINLDAQLAKLEEQTPEPQAFDFFGVFPALDVCMAMMSLLQGAQNNEYDDLSNVGKLSENSVRYYVDLLLAEQHSDQETIGDNSQAIEQHPLMAWEIATQNELYDFIKDAPENKQTLISAKKMVLEEGLSNLGIEIG
ncbi:MAG: YjaG family protein [Cognaticolwellia aestuarii]